MLLDTKATVAANFFTPGLVKQLGLQCQETDATLRLAEATESPMLGLTKLKMRFRYFTAVLLVTELCADFDATLGNAIFIEHRAVLDFANATVTLTVMANFTQLVAAHPE